MKLSNHLIVYPTSTQIVSFSLTYIFIDLLSTSFDEDLFVQNINLVRNASLPIVLLINSVIFNRVQQFQRAKTNDQIMSIIMSIENFNELKIARKIFLFPFSAYIFSISKSRFSSVPDFVIDYEANLFNLFLYSTLKHICMVTFRTCVY